MQDQYTLTKIQKHHCLQRHHHHRCRHLALHRFIADRQSQMRSVGDGATIVERWAK